MNLDRAFHELEVLGARIKALGREISFGKVVLLYGLVNFRYTGLVIQEDWSGIRGCPVAWNYVSLAAGETRDLYIGYINRDGWFVLRALLRHLPDIPHEHPVSHYEFLDFEVRRSSPREIWELTGVGPEKMVLRLRRLMDDSCASKAAMANSHGRLAEDLHKLADELVSY